MEYNSHRDIYTNHLAQVPDDSLDIIQIMSKFQEGPGIQIITGHTIEIPKAKCVDRMLSAWDLQSFWPLVLKIYMRVNSSKFHLPSLFCVAMQIKCVQTRMPLLSCV